MPLLRFAAVLALLAAAAAPAAAQSIKGHLVNRIDDRPIAAATVLLIAGNMALAHAVTDSTGAFQFPIPQRGFYRLGATRDGFREMVSAELAVGPMDSIQVVFRLAADTSIRLEPLEVRASSRRVSASLVGFYERAQRHGAGRFIMRDQIDSRRTSYASDYLRTVPGLTVRAHPRGLGHIVTGRGGCEPLVFVDGFDTPLMGMSIDDLVPPGALEGIEIYPGPAGLPPEFFRYEAGCGVIILWTRMRT